jgi:hypothetical protein
MSKITAWSKNNKIRFNEENTKVMVILRGSERKTKILTYI